VKSGGAVITQRDATVQHRKEGCSTIDNQDKVDKLIAELGEQGYSEFTVAPPLFRMLWSHGIDIPPPLFMPFWSIVVFMGSLFAVGFGAYAAVFILPMWLMGVENTPIVRSLVATVFAGLFFGVTMATYFRYQARKLQLPGWNKYPAD